MTRFLCTGGVLGAVLLLSGCGATGPDMTVDEVGFQDLASGSSYVTLRADLRRCVSPLCGGYWIRPVNSSVPETYVSGLDLSGIAAAARDAVTAAPTTELVLRGRLGPREPRFHTAPLVVTEAYRGMPGMEPARGARFYRMGACANEACVARPAVELNVGVGPVVRAATVSQAAQPLLDQAWLSDRLWAHGAIAAGALGQKGLDASQVYLRLPDPLGPCPVVRLASCGAQVWTYTRDAERCVLPDRCVTPMMCPMYLPSCGAGYQLESWPAAPGACPRFACDPSFVTPSPGR